MKVSRMEARWGGKKVDPLAVYLVVPMVTMTVN